MLTGKAKIEFEKWYIQYAEQTNYTMPLTVPNGFYAFHPSMQWGVYVDWLDSVGINIEIEPNYYNGWSYGVCIASSGGKYEVFNLHKTRHEARTQAIKKANLIYNKS